jgi:hypothetical protein
MEKTTTLSTLIRADVKQAIVKYCKQRGLKLRYLVEKALIEQLEDEMDIATYYERRDEETIPLAKIQKGRKK